MKQKVLEQFQREKQSDHPLKLFFKAEDGSDCALEMMTKKLVEEPESIELLVKWREENAHAFPAQFKVTLDGTKIWCQKAVIENPERVLFWVLDKNGVKVGHIGLFRLSPDGQHVEIDNIVRGEIPSAKKIMRHAIRRMLEWQRKDLRVPKSYLRVFSDNPSAIRLYEDLGYKEIQRVPLKKCESQDRVEWKEIINNPYEVADKYFVTMYQARVD